MDSAAVSTPIPGHGEKVLEPVPAHKMVKGWTGRWRLVTGWSLLRPEVLE